MAITALTLRNFRSFREAGLRLRPFLLLVGRNAAGKSNLIQGFLFLRDIARSGLANAISLQGGLPYLQNAGLACGRDLAVEVELTLPVEMAAVVQQQQHLLS
jgi:predicted ATPase